jgi:hypothetical protein
MLLTCTYGDSVDQVRDPRSEPALERARRVTRAMLIRNLGHVRGFTFSSPGHAMRSPP